MDSAQPDYPPLLELQDKVVTAEQALILAAHDQNVYLGKNAAEAHPEDPLYQIDQDARTADQEQNTMEFLGNCQIEQPNGHLVGAKAARFVTDLASDATTAEDFRAEEVTVLPTVD